MKDQKNDFHELQMEHLDKMIVLAFKHEAAMEKLIKECDHPVTPEDEQNKIRTWQRIEKELDKIDRARECDIQSKK